MKSIKRFFIIFQTLFPPFLGYILVKDKPESKKYKERIFHIRQSFQKLGPTYIKFGQMLSARPDLIGMSLAGELRNLLDNEPIIPYEEIEKVLETELKQPVGKVFRKIEHSPLATASIAQVHKATFLNDHTVAIKIQRPGIEKIIQSDLPVLKRITKIMDVLLGGKGLKFSYIYEQFSDWISHELDFQVEGHRSEKIRENIENLEGIIVPKIYWNHTTAKVLTMEFVEGHTINNLLELMQKQKVKTLYDVKLDFKIDPDVLIKRLIRAVAKQSLVDRFFHGDLHPANIIVGKHNTIAFVDFGIVGSLNEEEHTQILMAMMAIVEGDPESLTKIIASLITDPLTTEQRAQIHQTFSDELHKLHEDVGGKITLNHVVTLLFPISEKYHVVWSPGFLLAVKTIGQLDTVAGLIGIRTSLVELMKPEVERALALSLPKEFSKETLFKNFMDLIQTGKKLPQTLEDLQELIHSTDVNKITTSISAGQQHAFRNTFLAGTAFVVMVPFILQSPLITILKPAMTILLPLLFIIILVKIFTIGRK